jgi:hypothetical protein
MIANDDPPAGTQESIAQNVTAAGSPSVTVAVVGICGAAHLVRCLDALAVQEGAPPFDVIVAYDWRLEDVAPLRSRYPQVRLVARESEQTPVELAARALREARGEFVLLTEDHCIPRPDWVRRLCAALLPGRAAVGGLIETDGVPSTADWAFWFTDFFRYTKPIVAGPSAALSVCNVAYRRSQIAQVAAAWGDQFLETAAHEALRRRFGPLWMVPEAEVRTKRSVRLADAIQERYGFGRLFAYTRIQFTGPARRMFYAALAPALPLLLMVRMARKALHSRACTLRYCRALPELTLLVLAWSWGEWLGYLTRRGPRSLAAAPDAGGCSASSLPG